MMQAEGANPPQAQAVAGSLIDFDLTKTALVLFNKNSSDSIEIATYYAEKRGISNEYLCGVNAPLGDFISLAQLKGIRNQILKDCLCPILDESSRPTPCDSSQLGTIVEASPIRSLVYVQGIPLRLYDTGWTQSYCSPPLPASRKIPL